jgi:hypothetical protein
LWGGVDHKWTLVYVNYIDRLGHWTKVCVHKIVCGKHVSTMLHPPMPLLGLNIVFGMVFNLDELNALKYILISFCTFIITNNKMWDDLHEHGCNCQIYFMYYTNKIMDLILHFLNMFTCKIWLFFPFTPPIFMHIW